MRGTRLPSSRKLFLLTRSGRRWQEVRTATSSLPALRTLPGAGAELEIKFAGAPSGLQAGPALGGTPDPREGGGHGRRPGACGGAGGKVRSAVGIRTRSQKRREQEPGSWEPPAAACRSPQSASFFSEDSVLAPSLSRKNEVKPPVHRVRQRDLLCGDLLALPDAGPGSLRLPQEPAPRGLFSPGKHRRGALRG